MRSKLFHRMQRMGKALMVPVAVLPMAGLLLGLAQSGLPSPLLASLLFATGEAIFTLLPLMFAVAVALTFCHQDGTAALAALTGFAAKLAAMATLAQHYGWETTDIFGFNTLNTGVLGGVLIGIVTSWVYREFHQIRLPELFAFFAGRRFVPLINILAGMVVGIVMALLWPLLQQLLAQFTDWTLYQRPLLAWGIYGAGERLLIPLGLHHIWNLPFMYEVGSFSAANGQLIHGEVNRFLAGDANAGHLAGGYLIKMFGLPAAALAIWRSAEPRQRKQTASIMLSAALTSWLTGVTEPIEFAFLFISPLLFTIHALLTGLAYILANWVELHHGIVFSHGLIDFLLYFHLADNLQQLLWLGPLFALIYYVVFRSIIVALDLPTPGRNRRPPKSLGDKHLEPLLLALGGAQNLKSVDACLTRLRLSLHQPELIDKEALTILGAKGVLVYGEGVQIVLGPQAERISGLLQQALKGGQHADKNDGINAT
ncbi:PTS transporter subunit EIIC [Ferrimonas senticii]|uniref:PTS transporter subunit EIIC n=1 Tax=Ferrimonas senticii TaxID=394566 RepID=UPI00041844B9|nr:PTS transporter subunit EIIC [Ferrimonas senticii]